MPRHARALALAWVLVFGSTVVAEEGGPTPLVTGLTSSLPRPFGYMVGDWVEQTIDFQVAPGWRLDTASLPKPGSLDYWLDLLAIDAEFTEAAAGRHYRLWRRVQTFYFNRETKALDVPGLRVSLIGPDGHEQVELPGFEFTTSTLHETAGVRRDEDGYYLRPDSPPPRRSVELRGHGPVGLAMAVLAGLLLLREWPGLGLGRARRPFALALARLRAESARGQQALTDAAWLALHRALDATHGRALMQADIPAFLRQHPRFDPAGPAIEQFFKASAGKFFASGGGAGRTTSEPDLLVFARQMARLEARD